MEFPPTWNVLLAELMDTYQAPDCAGASLLLKAQLRPSGRILDGFQLALGGTNIHDANVDMGQLIPASNFKQWKLKFQFWPRDVQIRRNMMTSSWHDIPAMICSNEATVFNEKGEETTPAVFMELLDLAADFEPEAAAIRWAVIVGEDNLPRLQLQGLPASAVTLSGRHQFKGSVPLRIERFLLIPWQVHD